jgi:hypothetical protein
LQHFQEEPSEIKPPELLTEAGLFFAKIPKLHTLKDVKPNWIVPGLIVKGGLHVFAGEAGAMKSFLALHIAGQLSRGGLIPQAP